MRFWVIVGLILGIAGFAPGGVCAAEARNGRADSSALTLQRGVELYDAGQTAEALARLRGFVVRHGDSPLLPEAYLYLARIFRDSGQYREALLYIERIPPGRRGNEVRLVEGAALVGAGEVDRGVAILQELEGVDLSTADRRLRFDALAEGQLRLGRPLAALFFIHRALTVTGPRETEELLQRAHTLLRDRLSEGELSEAAFMFGGTPIGEDARLQQALRAFARGDGETARRLAQGVVQSPVPFPYRRDAVLLLERLTGSGYLERAVGVVLPLTGRYGTFGTLVRRGMELAQQIHHDNPVRFVFIDSDADPDRSAQAVSELTREQRVMAIAGPLTGGAAAAAATRAQQEKIPLLSLSQRDGIPQAGDHVFRLSLTSRAQVAALVQHAMEEKGLRQFAVLAPENRQGQEMTEIFVEEVKKRGGRVTATQSYAENATDFKPQLFALQGLRADAPSRPAQGEEKRAPLSFQALFIPDYADRIVLIAPQVAFYGIRDIQLLGINGWNSPELLRQAGDHVEGAIFVDGFFRNSFDPVVREFVRMYQDQYGEEPSILEAQGFDAANILLSLLSSSAVRNREELRQGLLRLNGFQGATGATSFDSQGEALKELFVLQVQKGEIVQIR